MVASQARRGGGRTGSHRFWLTAILGAAVALTLCNVGFAQPPLSGNGDPTNDLPGTLHDFSSTSPTSPLVSADDVGCLACHDGPDLNHDPSEVLPADYTTSQLVSITDSDGTVIPLSYNVARPIPPPTENTSGFVGPESGVCLDCHDGTVPVGRFPQSVDPDFPMDDDGNLGTDLRVHHPVSFAYPSDAVDWYNLNPSTGGTGGNVPR